MQPREATHVIEATPRHEGKALVYRALPSATLPLADPFLSLSEYWLKPPSAAYRLHPNQGAEIVAYQLGGVLEHDDRDGFHVQIQPGEAFNMTAGTTFVDQELPVGSDESHGILLWVDLPQRHKRVEPEFRKVSRKEIPLRDATGIRIRTLVSENGPMYLRVPALVLDITLNPGARFTHPLPLDWNALAYVLEGSGEFGNNRALAEAKKLVHFGAGDLFEALAAKNSALRFILMAGEPQRKIQDWVSRIA